MPRISMDAIRMPQKHIPNPLCLIMYFKILYQSNVLCSCSSKADVSSRYMCASFLVASRSIPSPRLGKLWPKFHKCSIEVEYPHASPSNAVREEGRVLPSRWSKLGVKRDEKKRFAPLIATLNPKRDEQNKTSAGNRDLGLRMLR